MSKILNAIRRLTGMKLAPGEKAPDFSLLSSSYLRRVTAPYQFAGEIGKAVSGDADVINGFPKGEGRFLLEAGVVGDDLCLNLYPLLRFRKGPLDSPYDPNWMASNTARFVLNGSSGAQGEQNWSLRLLDKAGEISPDVSYNRYAPVRSFVRTLADEQLAAFEGLTQRRYKEVA